MSYDIFDGFVDVIGASNNKIINGSFQVANTIPTIKLDIGNSIIDTNFSEHQLYSVSGTLNDTIDGNIVPISHANIYFFKYSFSHFSDFSQRENIKTAYSYPVYDYCKTDLNGNYKVFLEPGTYTIKIDSGVYTQFLYNQEFISGLTHQYYFKIYNESINTKYNDVIILNNTNLNMINGTIYDMYHKPLNDAQIIISQNDLVIVYYKTNKDGKYNFLLQNGEYDIRIRHSDYSIKKIEGFQFENSKGFMSDLKDKFNWFHNNDWITIK